MALSRFSPAVRAWFNASFPEPTVAQAAGWPAIANGDHTLILAPTGSGKTLAAFLSSLDTLLTTPAPLERSRRTRVLYISPLRALAVDVDKNLRSPLVGIRHAAERLGQTVYEPVVEIRTGDTPADARRRMLRHPPDLLITTPESLFLMLTSQARDTLAGVQTVIIDEIHALAATKRGAHLALSLERLDSLVVGAGNPPVQRIGLSATQRPLEEIARFLGGATAAGPRPVTIVDAGVRKPLEVEVIVPIDDMSEIGKATDDARTGSAPAGPARRSIWPSIHPRLLELILAHRSTLIFANARRLAERLAAQLNELAREEGILASDDPDLVKAHHGSLAREQRLLIEDELKTGRLRGLVATSSLELGIDMGAIDLVIQVESPGAVSRGLQRIGRAGHQVGEPSKGKVFPKHRADLLEATVVVQRMRAGLIEHTKYLRNPLDVLAQQIVAMTAMEPWSVTDLTAVVRQCACFTELTDEVMAAVLDMLSGRYPSDEFSELRPRIVWDRSAADADGIVRGGAVRTRDGSQRLAIANAGTIPDRGLFGVFLPDGARVGELDEEMVYESRAGETFVLGASTWRIEEITFERVVVTPAPGQPGKMPFWHGDRPGRPLELGRAIGEFTRQLRALPAPAGVEWLETDFGLDELAARNLVQYLDDQADATGAVPDDRTIVLERFRDEIGDWRLCVLTPFGAAVHAPWAMAIEQRLANEFGIDAEMMWSDDGIVIRLPESVDRIDAETLLIDPSDIDAIVIDAVSRSALFSARFRECAGRALLLPRRRPGKRTPLWQQRQRAADLLSVASKYPTFPILLEATRECVNDVFDLDALRTVLADLQARRIKVVSVDTPVASPFAQSLVFSWISAYMYEGDAPLAERRAAALALDRDLLRDLLGSDDLRDLIDADVLERLEDELQRTDPERAARSIDECHDVLRVVGDLSADELARRCQAGEPVQAWVDELVRQRRAIRVGVGGATRFTAAEDAARLRDALGVAIPVGLPAAFTEPVPRPLEELVARYARTHGPFVAAAAADRLGTSPERVQGALAALAAQGRVVSGEFRPGGAHREWCDVDVLRVIRRRSLAALRREIEPVDTSILARFLAEWHGVVGDRRRGADVLLDALGVLQGAVLPASSLETDILPMRVAGFRGADLDTLCASGDLVWIGAGAIGSADGRIMLAFRDRAALVLRAGDDQAPGELAAILRSHLTQRGASFWSDLVRAAQEGGLSYTDTEVLDAVWDLVWAGEVTNDSFAALRAYVSGAASRSSASASRSLSRTRPRPGRLSRLGPPAGQGRWSLTAPMLEPRPSLTECAHAQVVQLLDRYGVLTREAVLAEGVPGGFHGIYPVLSMLEERGQVRRGYFVAGLGAAQFAAPGAVDRLRSIDADQRDVLPLVLAAVDPAQPYGAALSWPEYSVSATRPNRVPGALVVMHAGEAVAFLDRSLRNLTTFPAAEVHAFAEALSVVVKDGRRRAIELQRIDGEPAGSSRWADQLRIAGFVDSYRGLKLHA